MVSTLLQELPWSLVHRRGVCRGGTACPSPAGGTGEARSPVCVPRACPSISKKTPRFLLLSVTSGAGRKRGLERGP